MFPNIRSGEGPASFGTPLQQQPRAFVLLQEWRDLTLLTLLHLLLLHTLNFSHSMLLHASMPLLLQLHQPGVLTPTPLHLADVY